MKSQLISLMMLAVCTMTAFDQNAFGPHANLELNSISRDGGPCMQSDGLSLYYNSNREGGQGKTDLWVTTRIDTSAAWQAPVNLGPMINTTANEYNPSLSFDGLSLYFSSDRHGGAGGYDLWVSHRDSTDSGWSQATNLGITINSPRSDISPSISGNGLQLFFSDCDGLTPRDGGLGDSDLWVASRATVSAAWSTPVNLGPVVNSDKTDVNPILSFDGLMLFFCSDRAGGQGWDDMWVTSRSSLDGQWTTPKNMGSSVNCSRDDMYLCESPDGEMLYLCSNRSGGKGGGDIWQIPVLSRELFLQLFSNN